MNGEEFVLAVITIVMGSVVLIVGISKFADLIKAWLNRNQHSYDEETFNRLAKAFTQYRKDTERRLQNLEAIVTDEKRPAASKKLEPPHNSIEIDSDITEERKTGSGDRNLRNMLRE
jgi:hypothetical protein